MKLVVSRLSIGDIVSRVNILSFLIDFCLNIFFISVRSFFNFFANKEHRIVIISLHRLGDTIFTIPAIRELQIQSNEKLSIVCFPESVPIYKLAFDDVDFCELKHNDFHFNDRFAKRLARKKVKSLKPGIVLDLIGGMSSASLIFSSRAQKVVGISQKNFRSIFNNFVQIRSKPKLTDIYYDAVSTLIKIDDRERMKNSFDSFNPKGKILIHPFAAWREKEWSLKKFCELAVRLKKDYKVQIVSPVGIISQDIKKEIIEAGIEITESKSVDELIQAIKKCSIFIGNDSGPINIANFIGKPTFSIYGGTNPDYTASVHTHQPFIQKKLGCSAGTDEKFCLVGGAEFYCSGKQCMSFLSGDEVYKSVLRLAEKHCNKIN